MFQFKNFHFDYVKNQKYFIWFSVVTIVVGLFFIGTKGLNYGTDFKGGTNLQYRFTQPVSENDIRDTLGNEDVGLSSVQKIGKPEENRLLLKLDKSEEGQDFINKINGLIQAKFPGTTLDQNESVGPKAGADLRKKAMLSIIVSWAIILIYIAFRFNWSFAPGAIIALIHDVLLAVAAFSITGREITLTVVAALLTIIGYSINDTIVVYDRIRENIAKAPNASVRDIINKSLNEMFPRTIITSFTVFIVVALMYFFGEGEFQNFGFAMIIGVITGVYSTLSIACPSYIWLRENETKLEKMFQKKPVAKKKS